MTNNKSNDRLLVNSVLKGEKKRYSDIVRRYTSAVFVVSWKLSKKAISER